MRKRLFILIGAGLLLSGGLQLWLQFPNHFSDYLTRWEVQAYKRQTGTSSVPIPVDMSPRIWPQVMGVGLLLAGAGFVVLGAYAIRRCSPGGRSQ
jgi:hypothetical protein